MESTAYQMVETASLGLLSVPSRMWRVSSGAVDLFLMRLEAGLPVGARRPVTRVEAGEAILSPSSTDGFALFGQPAPGARVEAIGWRSLSRDDLERWVVRLGGALEAMPPESFVSLTPGQHIEVRQGMAVYSPDGLMWVRHTAGASRLLGWPALEPIRGTFPIAHSVWLACEEGTRLRREEPDVDDLPAGMEAFHRHVLAALAHQGREQDALFAERLRLRAQSDRANIKVAHRALAAVLEKAPAAVHAHAAGDPLLEAARAAGQALGISIVGGTPARRGASSKDPIESIARASAIRVRRVALNKGWWRRDGGPLVAYLENGQPVALLPKGPRRYELWDPVTRQGRPVNERTAALLRPFAHSLYRPFPAEKLNILKLLQFGVRGLERDAGVIVLSGALCGLLGLIAPVVSGILFDTVIPATDRPQLVQIFGILVAAAFSLWLLRLVQSFALLRVEGRMDASLQAALWDRLLTLPVTFYRGYTAGDLALRSLSISTMREVLTGTTLSSILAGIFSIFSVGLLFHYGVELAIPATGLIVLSFLVTVLGAMLQVRIQRKFAELSGRVAGLLPQLLGGISKLRVAGAEDRAFARWAVRFAEQKRLSVRSRRVSMLLSIFFPLFQAGTTMVLFALLSRPNPMAGKAGFSTGAFLAFQAAFLQVLAGASQLGTALISVLSIVPMYERARPILESLPEVSANKSDPGDLSGEVELAHVAFRYRPDLPAVLKDVSLRIRAGQFVAIVGATGSGKSSIFRLMLGFETPEAGSLFYDGQDLAGLDVQAVRRQTGVVLQQGGVLGGDIFSNIVGSSPLTMDDAWEAARMAGLDADIRNMPMGMHTVLPEGGLGLSGGQRQRLQIARAVVNRPRLILFDEATSALDNQTQAVVMESLSRLKATRVVIAHRLTTIRDADCIFVLNQGVIEESGTYGELMAHNGFFAELARRQLTW